MGNVSIGIDLTLSNLWKTWYLFRRGKRVSGELEHFSYYLERNLSELHKDLNTDNYKHGDYRTFIIKDNKPRTISVASIRDRVVHRILYEYLMPLYDKTFIFDVWSSRKNKGLVGAIARTQILLKWHKDGFVWRADIKKFFDNVDHDVLTKILYHRVKDERAMNLIQKVIASYSGKQLSAAHIYERERERE